MRRMLSTRIAVLLLALLPTVAWSVDYPNGINTIGVVTNVGSFDGGWVRFVVHGTTGGQQGDQPFWVDTNQLSGRTHYANILSASAQGKPINIWHYGDRFDFGGQTGYHAVIIFVSY